MNEARITLQSTNVGVLEQMCDQIKTLVKRVGGEMSGPVPMPTKHLKVPVRKSPCGDGSETWERWEMRIHKRLIDLSCNDRLLRHIMRVPIPDGVYVEINLTSMGE